MSTLIKEVMPLSGGICYIFGAGERLGQPPALRPEDWVIAADGGYTWLKTLGLRPHLLVGDFDSLETLPQGVDTVHLPVQKDDTDMAAAVQIGWKQGFRHFRLFGGAGGRLDHTLANLQLVAGLAERGGRGQLYDRDQVATAIHNGGLRFPGGCAGTVSVFAHSDTATGVWEAGLHYPLENATLSSTTPLGVSNRLTGSPASISVACGTLIILYPAEVEPAYL